MRTETFGQELKRTGADICGALIEIGLVCVALLIPAAGVALVAVAVVWAISP